MCRLTTVQCQEVVTTALTTPLFRLQLDLTPQRSNDCRVAMVSRDFKLLQSEENQLEQIYSTDLGGVIAGINFHYLYMEINPQWESKIRTENQYGIALAALLGTVPDEIGIRGTNPPILVSDMVKTVEKCGYQVAKMTEISVPF